MVDIKGNNSRGQEASAREKGPSQRLRQRLPVLGYTLWSLTRVVMNTSGLALDMIEWTLKSLATC